MVEVGAGLPVGSGLYSWRRLNATCIRSEYVHVNFLRSCSPIFVMFANSLHASLSISSNVSSQTLDLQVSFRAIISGLFVLEYRKICILSFVDTSSALEVVSGTTKFASGVVWTSSALEVV